MLWRTRVSPFVKSGRAWFAVKTIPTPYMADSITQGTLGSWEKKVGDVVRQDELVANIETDKVPLIDI